MNITQQSQSQEIVKVVRQETEVKICNVCIPISIHLEELMIELIDNVLESVY